MKAILLDDYGNMDTIELSDKLPRLPAHINVPVFGGGQVVFDRSGTTSDGCPIYGSLGNDPSIQGVVY